MKPLNTKADKHVKTIRQSLTTSGLAILLLAGHPTQGADALPKFTFKGVALEGKKLKFAPTGELERACLIKMEGRIKDPLGKYYIYYSPHAHAGIGLVYSDSIEGPWTEYKGNPLVTSTAIPDIHWIEETGKFHLWGHRQNSHTEMWTSTDGLHFNYHSTSVEAKNIGTKNATYTRVYEYPLEQYGNKYIMLYSGFIKERGIRCVWLAHSKDGTRWTQVKTPLVEPVEGEGNDIYGPSLFQWQGRNYIVYQDHTAYRGGNVKYVEMDSQLNPVGNKGQRSVLIEPVPNSPIDNRYRECEFYREGDRIYMFSSGGEHPRRIVYATAKIDGAPEETKREEAAKPGTQEVKPPEENKREETAKPETAGTTPKKGRKAKGNEEVEKTQPPAVGNTEQSLDQIQLRKIDLQTDARQRETHENLATPPKNGIEVAQGEFFSSLLKKEVPYRVFSPENSTWEQSGPKVSKRKNTPKPAGLPIAIYVLNIETPAPRPSSTSDRAIIEDLIKRGFLVAAVDFSGAKVSDHEVWARDINALIHVFGGSEHLNNVWHTENYNKFLKLPGPNEGREILSFSVRGDDVPIHRNRIYVMPPGYTVEYFHVINKDFGVNTNQPVFFMDIVYPMPGKETQKLPVVVAQTATGNGVDVMNTGTFVFYSWLFNGYALAVHCNVKDTPENADKYPIVQAMRYLRGKKDAFSLNGIVGTTGISKSSTRTWLESYFRGKEPVIKDGPFPEESSEVSINLPACAHTLRNDAILNNLSEDSPAIILTWGPLNNKGTDDGSWVEPARKAYEAKGLKHKLFYREVPPAGHEYPVYILNDIMAFWDKFCK